MDSVLLITISAFILAVILIIVTIVIIKRNQNKKYKKEIEELEKMGIQDGDTVKIFDFEFEWTR